MKPDIFAASDLFSAEPPILSIFGRRMLAEGDSWFTIGTTNPLQSSNVLHGLDLARYTAIVTCAYPGDTLQHMVDNLNDVHFDRLLRQRRFASYWEALLISGGGNDLIDAVQVSAMDSKGKPVPPDRRLLLAPHEAAQNPVSSVPERYISEAGWQRLADYLRANYAELVKRRDDPAVPHGQSSRGRPMFVHTYATPTVRPSGTLGRPKGWLYPALKAYGVPQADWQALGAHLFERLRQLLLGLDCGSGLSTALPHVHVFDSAGLPGILPAKPATTGVSGDWVNEIHLTPGGYRKLGAALGVYMEDVLGRYP